jgi:hypothetical protein
MNGASRTPWRRALLIAAAAFAWTLSGCAMQPVDSGEDTDETTESLIDDQTGDPAAGSPADPGDAEDPEPNPWQPPGAQERQDPEPNPWKPHGDALKGSNPSPSSSSDKGDHH